MRRVESAVVPEGRVVRFPGDGAGSARVCRGVREFHDERRVGLSYPDGPQPGASRTCLPKRVVERGLWA